MLGITDITTYIIGVIAIVLLPGPNSMFVLTTAAQQGIRRGYAAAAGVFVGDAVIMVIAVAGAATLLHGAPQVFVTLKIIGALYLGYLGVRMLIGAWKIWHNHVSLTTEQLSEAANDLDLSELNHLKLPNNPNPFKRALLICLVNPKAILFMFSFFVQFVSPKASHPTLAFLILGLILQFFSMLYLSILIFSGDHLAAMFRTRPLWMVSGKAAVGAMFLGFSAKLAMVTI